MNNDTLQKNTTTPSTSQRLLERIESEAITPTPRMQFVLKQWGIWVVWGLTVLVGAIALAVSGYVTLSAQYALYEATHENFLTFFVAVMPYIWVILFALMTYVSVYEIKQTKRGYRYSTKFVVGSNLLFTVLGALLLHCLGLGYALDQKLGQQIGMYMSMDKMEQQMWQMPGEGRLIGALEPVDPGNDSAGQVLNFKDVSGMLWRFNVDELQERELLLLLRTTPVRVIGTTTSEFSFHVCGVFPWVVGKARGRMEMKAGRQEFDAMMHDKMGKIEELADKITDSEPQIAQKDRLCARLPVMHRIR
jgi:hypothetical protein